MREEKNEGAAAAKIHGPFLLPSFLPSFHGSTVACNVLKGVTRQTKHSPPVKSSRLSLPPFPSLPRIQQVLFHRLKSTARGFRSSLDRWLLVGGGSGVSGVTNSYWSVSETNGTLSPRRPRPRPRATYRTRERASEATDFYLLFISRSSASRTIFGRVVAPK